MELDTALILAGGMGRRMGFDKKELVVGGGLLIDRLINTLRKEFGSVIVSSNTAFRRDNVITVKDRLGAGPLAGIYSALQICRSDYLYVIACDMPNVRPEYIRSLKAAARESGAAVILTEREDGFLEPFNAFYRKDIISEVEASLRNGEYKMGLLFGKLDVHKVKTEDKALFFNINYPEDLKLAESSGAYSGKDGRTEGGGEKGKRTITTPSAPLPPVSAELPPPPPPPPPEPNSIPPVL